MITEKAYDRAIEVLEKCKTPNGFFAAYPGYQGVWSRDSVITSLGASLIEERFKDTFKESLKTLGKNQSLKGQIPNAVLFGSDNGKVDYKSIDSTLWFIIGHYLFKSRYNDSSLLKTYEKNIRSGMTWLSYQDSGEDHLLEQQPTSDWQDAFPHRYGHTINTQALWYKTLTLVGNKKEAERVKEICNKDKEDGLWNGKYYYSFRWKNHNKYKEFSDWFDTLGNLLAILFDLADKKRAESILDYIKKEKIDSPYPIKAMHPPIDKKSKYWYDYFEDCEARSPHHYLNGGIWTFIGGFYVCALVKLNRFKEAEIQLQNLAEANLQNNGNFAEWLHGQTGKIGKTQDIESYQAWNAGTYILAYESLKKKKSLI
ncbi:hypothetical protein COU60_03465 [Candidatus Pacearchaeota archaeon CG10_big_fil_rev_8_21_14_0_10_34_76]|nr:MAG: hypothetical protein COU60_03465 [Candidatus Pacearchaeota archaeon CG10_big_fil_rev_8_21_14_0_10_34_76]